MIRKLSGLVVAMLVTMTINANAHDEMSAHKGMSKGMSMGKQVSLTGEVVDTGCYLAHEARGAKHVECATKCINNGMPMGLLTSKGVLYLITLNHDNGDAYNKLKGMAGQTATLMGTVMDRSGMKGIDVTEIKAEATSASK